MVDMTEIFESNISNLASTGHGNSTMTLQNVLQQQRPYHHRVYLPCTIHSQSDDGRTTDEYLKRYIEAEFPDVTGAEDIKVHSVPRDFHEHERTERQAGLAEQRVFQRLQGLQQARGHLDGLWLTFFHGACYAARSFRNRHTGKLIIREHDFVMFVKFKGKQHIVLGEVKSTHDSFSQCSDATVTSDAKVIKNNKRSAQHQLRDHLEMLKREFHLTDATVQMHILWPFLGRITRDPRQTVVHRWREDGDIHVYEDTISDQVAFDRWFERNVLAGEGITRDTFNAVFKRFIVLSCGVFLEEIHTNILALLTQNQWQLLTSELCQKYDQRPTVVHGAAGTGKTLLILRKLKMLHDLGLLDRNQRALYICYWPGVRCYIEQKLELLHLREFVDTSRYFISPVGEILKDNKNMYKHIFMDEAEALCLAFDKNIVTNTITTIYKRFHQGNCPDPNCQKRDFKFDRPFTEHDIKSWGSLWFLVDINQASIFIPKQSPQILKDPMFILTCVMRTTGNIYNVFKQFYLNPFPLLPDADKDILHLRDLHLGHNITGPPIYWVQTLKDTCEDAINCKQCSMHCLTSLVIDLCSTKGIKPNDLCVVPFYASNRYAPEKINTEISKLYAENGYHPKCVIDVESFITNSEKNEFLLAWALRLKGLEFKVLIMVMDEDDFDISDPEDRKKVYIMASRCTCLLILVCPNDIKNIIDPSSLIKEYPFSLKFQIDHCFDDDASDAEECCDF